MTDSDTSVSRTKLAAAHIALGPLNFIHGAPEHGPHQPDTLATVCGIVGTWLWTLPIQMYWGWI